MSGKLMASAHDGEIRIWDIRKDSVPVKYMTAHYQNIFSLDFSPIKVSITIATIKNSSVVLFQANQLVSSSADKRIKMWDVGSEEAGIPVNELKEPNDCPVTKVQYTPFGDGLVTLVSIPPAIREINNLSLWSASSHRNTPVHNVYGHTDVVQEFCWRNTNPSVGRHDFQLVTWTKDLHLNIWSLDSQMIKKMCQADEDDHHITIDKHEQTGEEQKKTNGNGNANGLVRSQSEANPPTNGNGADVNGVNGVNSNGNEVTRANSTGAISRTPSISPVDPNALKNEFATAHFGEKLTLVTLDIHKRHVIMQADTYTQHAILDIRFPKNYPNIPPTFELMTGTTLPQENGWEMIRKLSKLAAAYTSKQKTCLDACLRQFESEMAEYKEIEAEIRQKQKSLRTKFYKDSNVPFPRTSGARFCGSGQLVCFGWTFTLRVPTVENETVPIAARKTPRALSSLSQSAKAAVQKKSFAGATAPTSSSSSNGTVALPEGSHTTAATPLSESVESQRNFQVAAASITAAAVAGISPVPSASSLVRTPSKKKLQLENGRQKMVRMKSTPAPSTSATSSPFKRPSRQHLISISSEPEKSTSAGSVEDSSSSLAVDHDKHDGKDYKHKFRPLLTIYDARAVLYFSPELAVDYRITGSSPTAVCKYNANVAIQHGYRDLARTWWLASKLGGCIARGDRLYLTYTLKLEQSLFFNCPMQMYHGDELNLACNCLTKPDGTSRSMISEDVPEDQGSKKVFQHFQDFFA